MSYDPALWEDEYPATRREYKRNFIGMPPRHEWNSHPMRAHEKECPSCGYRHPSFELNEPGHNGRCWNCFMCETQPHQVKKFWQRVESNNAPAPVKGKEGAKIVRLGDGVTS